MIKNIRLRSVLAIAVIAVCLVPVEQSSATESDPADWTIFTTTDAYSKTGTATLWHYSLDAQSRYFEIGSGANHWLVRPGIG